MTISNDLSGHSATPAPNPLPVEAARAIIGRAEYSYMTEQYLVRYRNGAGNQIENWWPAEAIVAV